MAGGDQESAKSRAGKRKVWILLSLPLVIVAWWILGGTSSPMANPKGPTRTGVSSSGSEGRSDHASSPEGAASGERNPMEALAALMRSRIGTFGGRLLDAGTGESLEIEAEILLEAGVENRIRGRSDAHGVFRFEEFPYPTPVRITVANEDEGIDHVESLFVENGETSVDLRIVRRTLLRGRIEGIDGRGLAGATIAVACFVRDGDPVPADGDEVVSHADGRFRLLLDGAWGGLKVAGKGGAGWQAALGVVTRPRDRVFEALIRAEYCWAVHGEVVDGEGRPVADARVLLGAWKSIAAGEPLADIGERRLLGVAGIQVRSRVDGSGWEVRNTTVRTDARGRFEGSPLLPAEKVFITIHKEGCPPKVLEFDGREERGATDRLDMGRIVLDKPASPLRVRLRRENGDPVAGVPVTLSLHRLPTGCGVNSPVLRSDGDGWIQSDFLEAGTEYILSIHEAGVTDMSLPMPVFVAQDGGSVVIPNPGRN